MRRCASVAGRITGAAVLALATTAIAQTYPTKPVRIIVPFSPGGSADNLARSLQPGLSSALGQQVVLDNRPGASSIIGTQMTAEAPPDGHTLLLVTTTHTVAPSLVKKIPYDAAGDFAGISLIVSQANILAVHPSVPARSVKELVALAKAKPDTLTYASGGNGSSPHLSGELLNLVAGIQTTHVPYKGSGPGVLAVVSGQVTMMFAGPLAFEQQIKAGRLRPLAVADRKRSSLLPDVPTMAEAGYPGIETGTWYGLLAPAKTPRPVIEKIHQALIGTLQSPEMRSRLTQQGVDLVGSSPEEFDRIIRAEMAKWAALVKKAKIAVD
jgi:tripartite-type tricarboxylate transporter receptor subunit TctC